MFQASFHSIVTLRASWYAPPDTGVSSLRRVAFESLRQNVLRIKIIGQYEFALDFKLSRERSKKTEAVFLVGSRRSGGKSKSPPNRECSLRFGKEEMSTEDKKPCLQGFVPPWSFLTRLRRPYLFPCAGKDRGEKGAGGCEVHSASEFRQGPMFWSGVPHETHLTGVLLRAA